MARGWFLILPLWELRRTRRRRRREERERMNNRALLVGPSDLLSKENLLGGLSTQLEFQTQTRSEATVTQFSCWLVLTLLVGLVNKEEGAGGRSASRPPNC